MTEPKRDKNTKKPITEYPRYEEVIRQVPEPKKDSR